MSDRSREEMEAHKAIVRAFLVRCRDWAQQREIPKRTRQLAKTPNAEGAAKLHAWISYDHFLEHTLDELGRWYVGSLVSRRGNGVQYFRRRHLMHVWLALTLLACGPGKQTLTGEVLDVWGAPVSNATVIVVGQSERPFTDTSGRFTIDRQPGEWRVKVGKEGYIPRLPR